MPIGPRGLEPSARLLALDGQRVSISGFMVNEERPVPGRLIFAPVPVMLAAEDEPQADDLPATAIYVHFPLMMAPPQLAGRMRLSGHLRLAAHAEADGRVAQVQLELDPAPLAALLCPTIPATPLYKEISCRICTDPSLAC
ncbi:hypothetical protein [Chitinimonas sp.]|uniref:hypothetical protein n=1 Tax=Chitinimonas sp. TaxID=1934313 RepID=UPI0035B31606